ncbi:ATP-binding protein [Nannocystis pusilla]|uniref:histidine kinase n=1 Tax=Nannocystis pusilla TaxID=889268 RepID=A0ABS7TUG2_9BACT|nr:ATP-binding protein [Nannocystis pusilla]MBZ5711864.1 GAF domain-containing protein [Nannocystis pusilla]
MSAPPQSVNLDNCDSEPIHVPGSIQPFGLLLVLDEPALVVLQVSANSADFLGEAPGAVLGRPVSELLDEASFLSFRACVRSLRGPEVCPLHVATHGGEFDGLLHRHQGVLLLELERIDPSRSEPSLRHLLGSALARIQAARSLDVLVDALTREVRRLTGFDRVLVYRFDEAGHGEVIAESRGEGVESYMGQRYPASDIPRQARRLYTLNWLRIVPDTHYRPVPLVPPLRPDIGEPLDLSFSVLRSVSPIHVEYLHNMGLGASMSVSLVHRGELWGLLCAHHHGPRPLPYSLRAVCEVLGRVASLQIVAMVELAARCSREARQTILASLDEGMRGAGDDVLVGLAARESALLELVLAEGAAIWSDGGRVAVGRAPPLSAIEPLVAWLAATSSAPIFATASLPRSYPGGRGFTDIASGLLAVRLPRPQPNYVLWFRPERVHTVHWGGNPDKPVEPGPTERLHPRRSFALWQEIVRETAAPWQADELEAAEDLRRRALEIDLARQVELAQKAVRLRDDLVAVVSHDLRNPLGVIEMAGAVISRGLGRSGSGREAERMTTAIDRIQRSVARMSNLIDELLDVARIEAGRFELTVRVEDAKSFIDESVGMLRPLAEPKQIRISPVVAAPGLQVRMDRERIFQVVSNLIGNAIKFTAEGGTITIGAAPHDEQVWFFVRDTGPGIPEDQRAVIFERHWQADRAGVTGVGLGLFVVRGIVEAHGGRAWVDSEVGRGSTFYFSLPAA